MSGVSHYPLKQRTNGLHVCLSLAPRIDKQVVCHNIICLFKLYHGPCCAVEKLLCFTKYISLKIIARMCLRFKQPRVVGLTGWLHTIWGNQYDGDLHGRLYCCGGTIVSRQRRRRTLELEEKCCEINIYFFNMSIILCRAPGADSVMGRDSKTRMCLQ